MCSGQRAIVVDLKQFDNVLDAFGSQYSDV